MAGCGGMMQLLPEQPGGNPANYRNAMVACLDARGYSAR